MHEVENPSKDVTIAMCGKYTELSDSYKSLNEALRHAGIHNHARIKIEYIDSELLNSDNIGQLGQYDGILVPGGFGKRGVEGKILAAQFAREQKIPYLGICLGMQVATIEYARHMAGLEGANSTEFEAASPHPVIALIDEWQDAEGNIQKRDEKSAMGGTMRLGDGFHADDGTPFQGQINFSRQNGNPGRVAGDKRPGAKNFVVGGEASPHMVEQFQSDNRWTLGFDRLGDGRYGSVQAFSLDTVTLAQKPLHKILDSANGRVTGGAAPGNQITRFGGDVAFLDNGNYVSMVEDRSKVLYADGNAAVATIFAPDGSVVTETFVVATGDVWQSLAAYKGGFVVRVKSVLYFFDNAGVPAGSVNQSTSNSAFDGGRGDGTRLFGHINSPYVYLAGKLTTGAIVRVAAWDSRDRSFVASMDVSEPGFTGDADRVNGAVDALNRLTVSWVSLPTGYIKQQVAARVLQLDGAAKTITAITPSFFAFINTSTGDTIRSIGMSVAMTTKQICIAAKGEINSDNKPDEGANTPTEVNFYTVLSHPAPAEDPTTPVGGGAAPTLKVTQAGGSLTLSWPIASSGFTLQKASSLSAPISWTAVTGVANNSVSLTTSGSSSQYFRLIK